MTDVVEDLKRVSNAVFRGGEIRGSDGSDGHDVIDPATENVIGSLAESPASEIDASIAEANAAQRNWWRNMSAVDRAHALHEVADEIVRLKPRIAEALTREMGKPYKESVDEVDWCVHSLRYSAEIGRSDMGRVVGPAVAGQMHYTLKQPLGRLCQNNLP